MQDFLNLTHQQALGWRVSKIIFFCFDSDKFCCYDFDMVSVTTLICVKLVI